MAQNIIGLDIGGTKISGIVLTEKNISRQLSVPTPRNKKAFSVALARLVDLLSSGRRIDGMGIGIAGIVDAASGRVKVSPNLKFLEKTNLKKLVDFPAAKISVDNDANCFALAEATLGKGRAYKNFAGLTLGTGIGGGIVLGGKLYRGTHGGAGEVGHIMADLKNDSEYYYQKARDRKDYDRMGKVLGVLLANVTNALDVEAIILGGSVATGLAKRFLPETVRVMRLHAVNKGGVPKVVVSSLKNAGALGAALLCG